MQTPFQLKFLQSMGLDQDLGTPVTSKGKRLEELLEWKLISDMMGVEGENVFETIDCSYF